MGRYKNPSRALITPETEDMITRPADYSEDVVKKLENVFKLDVPMETACQYAGVSQKVFKIWLKEKPEFAERIARAKNYAVVLALSVVLESIADNDVKSAKWWLERRLPEKFNKDGGGAGDTNVAIGVDMRKLSNLTTDLREERGLLEQANESSEGKSEGN